MQCKDLNNTTIRLHTCRNWLILLEDPDLLPGLLLLDTCVPVNMCELYGEEYGDVDGEDDNEL